MAFSTISRNSTANNSSDTSSFSVTIAGDLITGFVVYSNASTLSTVTIGGASCIIQRTENDINNGYKISAFTLVSTISGSKAIVFTWSGGTPSTIRSYFTGYDGAGAVHGVTGNAGFSFNGVNTLTTTINTVWLVGGAISNSGSLAGVTNFTTWYAANNVIRTIVGDSNSGFAGYKTQSTNGTGGNGQAFITLALSPAGSDPSYYNKTISFDSASSGYLNYAGNINVTHNVSGLSSDNKFLIAASTGVGSVTYDGVSMQLLLTYTPSGGTFSGNCPIISLWGLNNPNTGNNTLTAVTGSQGVIVAASYLGCGLSQIDAYNTAHSGSGRVVELTQTVVNPTQGGWVGSAAIMLDSGGTPTAYTGATSRATYVVGGGGYSAIISDLNAAKTAGVTYTTGADTSIYSFMSTVLYSIQPYQSYTLTGPASGNVNSASTNFTVTPDVAITGTITITPSGAGSTGLSPTVLTFSNSAVAQTFTITPLVAGAITLTPTTGTSLNNPSYLTYTANAVVPGAPTIGTATPGNTNASITFSAPTSDGGATITTYTATSTPGSITGTSATSPVTVTGLSNGTPYTFKVKATNSAGTGTESSASNSVTPYVAATSFTFTGPSSGAVRSASTNFTVTPNAVYYGTITLTPTGVGSAGLSSTTLTWSGTSTAQTFTITPLTSGAITLTPTNSNSLSNPANLTYTASAVVPLAPGIGIASRGNTYADVTVSAPSNDGGATVTTYTVTSSPGGLTGVSTSVGAIRVSGLTNGVSYTFTATCTNSVGTSASSSATNAVIPSADSTNFTNSGPKFNITKSAGNLIQF
jgi:hypothetical protein